MATENFAAEFYGLPTYFIQKVVSEVVGFNVRVYHWEDRNGILAPLFTAIVAAADLPGITEDVRAAADRSLSGWGKDFGPRRASHH